MVCIYCSSPTAVKNSRLQRRNNTVWRRRACLACGIVFTTVERPDLFEAFAVSGPDTRKIEPFNRDRLFLSIYESCKHRADALDEAAALTQTVINGLRAVQRDGVISRQSIAQQAHLVLKRYDNTAATFYAAYHSFEKNSGQTTS